MKKQAMHFATDILVYFTGCFIYSAAVTMLITPNEITPGGITGVAAILNHLFMIPTGLSVFILNVPLLIYAFLRFGGVFIAKTAVATVAMSVTLEITEAFLPKFTIDPVLAAVFGGILTGTGLSTVMLRGATTGGVDIIAKIINSRYPHITVGRLILATDAVVVAVTAVVYNNIESALYSVISLYASSRIMDVVLYGSDKGKIIYIITENWKELSSKLISAVQRGVTIIDVVGAYTGSNKKMLMCTVRRHQVYSVCRIIGECAPDAFTVIGEAGEIFGQGFKNIEK